MKYRLVRVEWHDATGGERTGWRPLKLMKANSIVPAVSVGYVVSDTDEQITLCPHVVYTDTKTPHGDGEITIPRSWIDHVVDLIPDNTHITLEE